MASEDAEMQEASSGREDFEDEEEDMAAPAGPSASLQNKVLTGRTVRLHFRCRAELPMGSSLRVTGSSLWAPGSSVADPADAAVSVNRTEASSFPVLHEDSETTGNLLPHQSLYSSSVEMVTTPEEYPVWRTRKPVVLVLPHNRKTAHHHYYRYLVVSPGGRLGVDPITEEEEDMDETTMVVSTSNEGLGTTAVLQWEDPFETMPSKANQSAISLASSTGATSIAQGTTKTDYRNLPYRTIDIDVQSAPSVIKPNATDIYGSGDDPTFQMYLIREAVSGRSILSFMMI